MPPFSWYHHFFLMGDFTTMETGAALDGQVVNYCHTRIFRQSNKQN